MARQKANPQATPDDSANIANQQETGSENPQDGGENPEAETPKDNGANFDTEFVVVNPLLANEKILGSEGNIIEFNGKGEATVSVIDAKRLASIEGYTVKER